MRSLLAVIALLGSIVGIALIIGYSATEGLIKLREDEEDLALTLLLGEVLDGSEMQGLSKAEFTEGFTTPCLGIPLLADGQRTGRAGLHLGTGDQPVSLLLARASESQAAAAMEEVARDVENNCARGVTVGRIVSAMTINPIAETGGDEAYGVVFTAAGAEDEPNHAVVFARFDDLIVRVEDLTGASGTSALQDAIDYAGLMMTRAANPPPADAVEAERKAQRSQFEKYTEDLNGFTERALTLEGRLTLAPGLAAIGLWSGLLLALGAMLNHDPSGPLPKKRPRRSAKRGEQPAEPQPSSLLQTATQPANAPDYLEEPAEALELEPDPEPEPVSVTAEPVTVVAPESIISPSREEVDRKLEVLREARLREPRPEPATPLPIEPEVDWTARLTGPDGALPASLAGDAPPPANPAPRPVDRRQLLRKLRVQYPVED